MKTLSRNRKGRETRATILRAANDILLEGGYGNFVFRDVAKRARVEPGNVQYYFPKKRDLLRAILEPELENYLAHLEDEARHGRTESDKIDRIVHFLIDDITSKKTLRLWISTWVVAAEDPELGDMLSEWYRTYIDSLSRLLRKIFPQLDAERAYDAATLITAQFDGLLIVLQIGRPPRKTIRNIRENIHQVVMRIINP